jgi:hypothetical protein
MNSIKNTIDMPIDRHTILTTIGNIIIVIDPSWVSSLFDKI